MYTVTVDYKNSKTDETTSKTYTLEEYSVMMSFDLKKTISDVEQSFVQLSGGKTKDEWDEQTLNNFNKIRRKLLNASNAFKRLPNTIK